ncbi:isatin hydrolase-like [Centruroides vittatus]|uniref:isatin hydrolase-like n=1 Tax=Centruroides vittatus TaxID=120091 RepID=UPI003510868A
MYLLKFMHFFTVIFICHALEGYLDMTYNLHEKVPIYPGITPLSVKMIYNGTEPEGYWLQLEDITTCVHVGTHMDAPCHFALGKWCINEIPLERLIAPAVVVDITSKFIDGSISNLMPEDLEKWESIHGKIPDGSILILKTGWGKFWNDNEKYVNGSEPHKKVPGISPQAASWLVANRKIYGVGVETLSQDEMPTNIFEAHVILQGANIYGIENIANVDKLPVTGAILYAMPVKLRNGSGAPARVFAKLPN